MPACTRALPHFLWFCPFAAQQELAPAWFRAVDFITIVLLVSSILTPCLNYCVRAFVFCGLLVPAGEEEVPPGVVGVVVLGDCPDVLSHCAVRARNCKIPVVACPRYALATHRWCMLLPIVTQAATALSCSPKHHTNTRMPLLQSLAESCGMLVCDCQRFSEPSEHSVSLLLLLLSPAAAALSKPRCPM
jgi:hypothetical protein